KTDDAPIGQFRHLRQVARNQPAPDAEVRDGGSLEGSAFSVELARVNGAGRGVERHIEEDRAASRRKRATAGRGAFPLDAARCVEVQMDVNQRGENMQAPGIDFGRPGKFWLNGRDRFAFDSNVGAKESLGCDNGSPAYNHRIQAAFSSSSKKFMPAVSAASTSSGKTDSS